VPGLISPRPLVHPNNAVEEEQRKSRAWTLPTPDGRCSSTVQSAGAVRWTWPILASGDQRDTLAHGRSLARSAESLSAVSDLSSSLQRGQRSGVLLQLLQKLAEDLRDRGKLDLSEAFVDANFSSVSGPSS
jgi:hypothetical protein